MPTNVEIEQWGQAQEYPIKLDKDGRIIDFLEPEKRRDNKPEERVRQRMVQVLHYEFSYPKELIAIERTINIGRERKSADIVIYATAEARASNDQGRILIISETKAPSEKEPDGQLISYISGCSAQGGFWTNDTTIIFYRRDPETGQIVEWLGIPKYGFA